MQSRLRPSPAMVIALIALFVSLGGTAAALSGSNTVFTDDIANDTVPASGGNPAGGLVAADLRPNSVGSSEVADESLGNGDFLTGSVDSRVVSDSSLTGADVSLNSLTGNDINESTLVGVKDGNSCISGAVLFGRLCAGSDDVNRGLFAASGFCASIGLRLPTWGEAVTLAVNHNVPGVGSLPERFWTDELDVVEESGAPYHAITEAIAVIVDENGNGYRALNSNSLDTVCVTTPD